jgi:hypothetical protein
MQNSYFDEKIGDMTFGQKRTRAEARVPDAGLRRAV